MMLTIAVATVRSLREAPLLAPSSVSLWCSIFVNPVRLGSHSLAESGLQKASFSRFLWSSVHLSQSLRLRGEVVTSRQVPSSDFDIERCQFSDISEADEPGGAVRCTYPVGL
jgi:hypothetical protein